MFKKLVFLIISLGLFFSAAYAGESFIVSGNVAFQHDTDIYLNLVTRETFQNRLEPLPPPFGKHIKLTPEQKKAKGVPFQFEGIPRGIYLLFAFQDLNKNGKLDRDGDGYPKEPFCTYKKFEFHLQWDRDSFLVDKDVSDIKITLEEWQ